MATKSSDSKIKTEIGKWNGHVFKVSSKIIYGFDKLTLKGSSETEDKTSGSQKYVKRKNAKPCEVSLTISINRMLGVKDVKTTSLEWVEEARKGESDYLYLNGEKVIKCKFMLTEADISDVELLPTGIWMSCNVKCTFKQSSSIDGSESDRKKSSSGHRRGGTSNKKKTNPAVQDKNPDSDMHSYNNSSSTNGKNARQYIKSVVGNAKKNSKQSLFIRKQD